MSDRRDTVLEREPGPVRRETPDPATGETVINVEQPARTVHTEPPPERNTGAFVGIIVALVALALILMFFLWPSGDTTTDTDVIIDEGPAVTAPESDATPAPDASAPPTLPPPAEPAPPVDTAPAPAPEAPAPEAPAAPPAAEPEAAPPAGAAPPEPAPAPAQ
jgi:hypothetical protein